MRALCDRRAGIGGDGVLRVVRTAQAGMPADGSEWFMDYRNADGSVSEMCGNGIRVFARYLHDREGEPFPMEIQTRDGIKVLDAHGDGDQYTADMGTPEVLGETAAAGAAAYLRGRTSKLLLKAQGLYAEAQRAVDYLSDQEFSVQDVTIVGVDLMQVERVIGRLTWAKVIGGGVISGAWLGVFLGLVLSIITDTNYLSALVVGVLGGIVFSTGLALVVLTGAELFTPRRSSSSRGPAA